MSLDKAIKYGKEHRRKYYDSRRFDSSCCNHGDCPWCQGNRMVQERRSLLDFKEQLEEPLDK